MLLASSLSATVIVNVFSPVSHVADVPFPMTVEPFLMVIESPGSVAVAVTLFVLSVVVAEYSTTSGLNAGDSVKAPTFSAERVFTEGPSYRTSELPASVR